MKASELRAHPANWRRHPESQAAAMLGALEEIGFCGAVLARETKRGLEILDGHLRADLAGDAKVPCLILDLTSAEAKKLLASYDPIGAAADVDREGLTALLGEIAIESEALGALLDEFAENADETRDGDSEIAEGPDAQIDRAAELKKKWKTKLGQLWEIPGKAGVHRLMCGDSRNPAVIEAVLNGATPFLMVSDPPYGVQYKPEARAGLKAVGLSGRKRGHIVGDEEANWQKSWELSPATVAYVWCASLSIHKVVPGLLAAKFEYRALIVWAKQKFVCGRSHYQWAHEICIYATRGAAKWLGGRGESTVWQINNAQGYMTNQAATEHPTEKPLECMRRPIRNHGGDGDAVYDPFLGSGTTMVAAEQLGRVCYGIEIEPKYVAVALERLADMGLKPRLAKKRRQP